MSTPEEQQRQQNQQHRPEQDPYGTQTWQSDTWDTSYQPVHPPLDSVPGQPVAPEGWFRDEAAASPAPAQDWPQDPQDGTGTGWSQAAAETAYLPPYQEPQHPQQAQQQAPQPPRQQMAAPDSWFRDPAPAPAPAPAAAPWPEAAAETAYLPPYQEPPQQTAPQQMAAPDGWFRDEAPAPAPAAPVQEWAETAYLPPQAAAPVEPVAPVAPVAAAAEPAEEPEYSPPTLAGNTLRAVDPAQARAEGRSPIIDPGPQSALLTAALGILLAVAAALGQYALLVPLIALQGLTAAGWFRLNGMWPARQGIALAFLGALVADVAVLAVDRTYGPGAIIGTLGAWVLLTLVLQLRSHADPDERMYGLMASVASAALAIVCAGYLAADSDAVSVGAAAVAVAVFARALPLPTAPSVGVSLAAAAGAGIALGTITGVGAGGALVGLAAGVCALVGLRVAAYDYPSKFVHMTAGVALPLAVAAPVVYLIGRVVA
ncbi:MULTISPECIES: hypothetical protein [unclassified Streptomyces]|uniref:hypothetical protein n=1 Tax=unclassified Streptomyces TaxID=2593676 RepID=UPI00225829C8|nr:MULTISPECIES: hypothetical protein [unclassified Streptomyces]MCX4526598.1 hypothetical protein [Streptomyces sp. NBC_01551]MCX4542839.1 hypothetical protein [Streptomyces sp. NBC_01565]